MNGGGRGTDGDAEAGDAAGDDAGVRARRRTGYVFAAAALLVVAAINALTVAHDTTAAGFTLDWWEPWLWELSSAAYWILMLPVFGWLAATIRPPRLRWPAAIAVHAALTVPVSALHIATLYAVRAAVYRIAGGTFVYALDRDHLLYEYRKDVLAYALLTGATALIASWARAAAAPRPVVVAPAPVLSPRISVRDGTRTWLLAPAEIDWAQAAGNYVELHTNGAMILHRATLASLETELAAHGFARIHRSRLVRVGAVRSVETTRTGDFDVVLANGARLAGSRRFRGALGGSAGANRPFDG